MELKTKFIYYTFTNFLQTQLIKLSNANQIFTTISMQEKNCMPTKLEIADLLKLKVCATI